MKPEELAHLEGLIVKAVQSGKKETSDLVGDIIHRIEPAVERSIEKYVNGHLREIKTHLGQQDIKLEAIEKKIQPVLENRQTVLNVGRFVIWMGALAGASSAIIWLTNWLVEKIRIPR